MSSSADKNFSSHLKIYQNIKSGQGAQQNQNYNGAIQS
jgi:hypothetical protein